MLARRAESHRPHPPAGNFNVYNSTLQFVRRSDAPQVAAAWDVQLACHQAALRGDLPLDNITGGIRVMGTADGANIDFLRRTGDRLADLERHAAHQHPAARIWSDSTICLPRPQATEKLGQPPRRINADVFGGTIASDVTV